ncbi:tetratricopeptide repeat protein [Haliangium sp.]|uniref:tetratricopeptide repeat protein n=1 Tax=Haliangium sp. TaxID=2663208 RepID=UPI003D0FD5D1
MWDGYSTREASELVGLPESAIRGCVRAGLITQDHRRVPLKLSFRDLRVLRAVQSLVAGGIPMRRLRQQLSALRRRLPAERSLAELTLAAHGGHVVVRERDSAWRADSGQMVLDFAGDDRWGQVHPIPLRREAVGPEPAEGLSAGDWFERALHLEEVDTAAAIAAYERALRLRHDAGEAWINLGRLHAESGNTTEAGRCFREALALDPGDATALYNLGVVAQDEGKDQDAIAFYRRALAIDASLAEAHYNLATLFDRGGDTRAAIRHINEYRKLTRQRG